MSLTIPQCVVGWFSVSHGTVKIWLIGGKGFEFLDACFFNVSTFSCFVLIPL